MSHRTAGISSQSEYSLDVFAGLFSQDRNFYWTDLGANLVDFPEMDPGPPHKRRRPAVTCTQCRRRKVGCDLTSPCGPCKQAGLSSQCFYNNHTTRSSETFSIPAPESDTTSNHLYNLEQSMVPRGAAFEGFDEALLDPNLSSIDIIPPNLDVNGTLFSAPTSSIWADMGFPRDTSNAQYAFSTSHLVSSISSSSYGEPGLGAEQQNNLEHKNEKESQQSSLSCDGVRLLLRSLVCHPRRDDADKGPETEATRLLMENVTKLECAPQQQQYERIAKVLNKTTPSSSGRDLLPSRLECDTLLSAYLNSFETVLPILDVPDFIMEYEHFWENSKPSADNADEAFECKLLSAITLGCCVSLGPHEINHSDQAPQERALGWITFVRAWFTRKMATVGVSNQMDMVQILCLLTLARYTQHRNEMFDGAMSPWGDYDPTRLGFQLDLHRDPAKRCPKMSLKDVEMRRRLWATMVELSLHLYLDEGLPPALTGESYDCELPSEIVVEENVQQRFPRGTSLASLTVFKLLAQSQRLRLRILHIINAPGASKAYEDSHGLAAELYSVCNANLDTIRGLKQPHATEFQIKMLDMFTRPFVLALHSPFADRALTNPSYHYSRQMRMELSLLILTYPLRSASHCLQNMDSNALVSGVVPSTGPAAMSDTYTSLSIHSNTHIVYLQRQAITFLFLDLISKLEENSFPMLSGTLGYLLRTTLQGAIRLFEQRMRCANGSNSVREFVVFTTAAAYVDALLSRGTDGGQKRDINETIAAAFRAVLTTCAGVIDRSSRPI